MITEEYRQQNEVNCKWHITFRSETMLELLEFREQVIHYGFKVFPSENYIRSNDLKILKVEIPDIEDQKALFLLRLIR